MVLLPDNPPYKRDLPRVNSLSRMILLERFPCSKCERKPCYDKITLDETLCRLLDEIKKRQRQLARARMLLRQERPDLIFDTNVKKRFICRICGETWYRKSSKDFDYPLYHIERHIENYPEERCELNIMMNIWIFKNPTSSQIRKDFAIYRLYRYVQLQPEEIADLLAIPLKTVRQKIRNVFLILSYSI